MLSTGAPDFSLPELIRKELGFRRSLTSWWLSCPLGGLLASEDFSLHAECLRSCAGQTAEPICTWLYAVRLHEAMSDARQYVPAAGAGCTGTGSCVHTSWSGVAASRSPGHQMTVEASGT